MSHLVPLLEFNHEPTGDQVKQALVFGVVLGRAYDVKVRGVRHGPGDALPDVT